MIKCHEFNTKWWSAPVGVVEDQAFFSLPGDEIAGALTSYDWVEFKAPLTADLRLDRLLTAGFFQADTQLPFILNLKSICKTQSTQSVQFEFADEIPFTLDSSDFRSFEHERFKHIPGCDEQRTNERFSMWSNNLISQHPSTCIRLVMDDHIQGWFLARPINSRRIFLTLAMLASDSTISGMLLYQKACHEFARKGYRLGEASFSVTNTAVHNMYSGLKARFLAPVGHWLWISEAAGGNRHG